MKVDIRDLQNKVKLDKTRIVRYAKLVLREMGESGVELSLLFVNDPYMRRLNQRYRHVDSRTDVLAFSMREGQGIPRNSPILGDVVISTETAEREAKKRKIPIQKEMLLYLAHGILHLLGYKDETLRDRKKMMLKQQQLLEIM